MRQYYNNFGKMYRVGSMSYHVLFCFVLAVGGTQGACNQQRAKEPIVSSHALRKQKEKGVTVDHIYGGDFLAWTRLIELRLARYLLSDEQKLAHPCLH
jgi:hypothetical protein